MLQAYIIDLLFGGCAATEELKKGDFLSLLQQGKFSKAATVLNTHSFPNDRLEFLELLYSNSKSLTSINKEASGFLITAHFAFKNFCITSNVTALKVREINVNNPFIHLLLSARLPIPFTGKAKLLLALDNLIIDLIKGKEGKFYIDFTCTEHGEKDFTIIKEVTEKILKNENQSFWLLFNTLGTSVKNDTFISLTQAEKIQSLQTLSRKEIGSWAGRIDSRLMLTITGTVTQEKFLEYTA